MQCVWFSGKVKINVGNVFCRIELWRFRLMHLWR